MPSQSEIQILRLTDAQLFQKVTEIAQSQSLSIQGVNVNIFGHDRGFNGSVLATDPHFQSILSQNARVTKWLQFTFSNQASIRVDRLNALFDNLSINTQGNGDFAAFFAFGKPFREKFGEADIAALLPTAISEEAKKDLEARKEGLAQLETVVRGFVEKLKEETTKQWKELHDCRDEDANQLKKKLDELEAAFAAKDAGVTKREQDLEKRRQEVDDRDYKYARRQGLKDQQTRFTALAKEFKLTTSTNRKRWPVILLYGLLSLFFGGGAALFAYKAFKEPSVETLTYIKQAAFTIAFATTVGFFIRWNDSWFREHASEEFRLKRLEVDIDRASWIYEMALEWTEQYKTEIPQYMMEKLTHNLFNEDGHRHDPNKNADTLASALVRGAKNISLKMGDNELAVEDAQASKAKTKKA